MSKFVEVETAELAGPSLDWAVAKCSGMTLFTMGEDWPGNYNVTIMAGDKPVLIFDLVGRMWREHQGITVPWSPSTDWAQGGPLLERFSTLIDSYLMEAAEKDYCRCDELIFSEHYRPFYSEISLPKICRVIVAAKLGDVVQVPVELMEVSK